MASQLPAYPSSGVARIQPFMCSARAGSASSASGVSHRPPSTWHSAAATPAAAFLAFWLPPPVMTRASLGHTGAALTADRGTLIVYLSDVAAGGGTRFPSLGLEVRPGKGWALYFADVDERGVVDSATLHAGLPVTTGVKLIATKWLRERVFGAPD